MEGFKIKTTPHVIKVTEDYHKHREVYVETGDLDAFRDMLASVEVMDAPQDAPVDAPEGKP